MEPQARPYRVSIAVTSDSLLSPLCTAMSRGLCTVATAPASRLGRGGSARLRRRSLVHDDDWVERYIAVDHYRVLVGGRILRVLSCRQGSLEGLCAVKHRLRTLLERPARVALPAYQSEVERGR